MLHNYLKLPRTDVAEERAGVKLLIDRLESERDQLRADVTVLVTEAEQTLEFYREKGRVTIENDGNPVQRLAGSAEIAISKLESEIEALKKQEIEYVNLGRAERQKVRQREASIDRFVDVLKMILGSYKGSHSILPYDLREKAQAELDRHAQG